VWRHHKTDNNCSTIGENRDVNTLLLALGGNLPGPWGGPCETQRRAKAELSLAGLRIVRSSRIYATAPVGPGRQAPYLNAVLLIEANVAPGALLRILKRIERRAGRRLGPLWGPRCLDIDALDYAGRRWAPPRRRREGRLILPHPEMPSAFVLVPLPVAAHWRHPAFGIAGRTLLARLGRRGRFGVRQTLDFAVAACDKTGQ
jgi:2-amino-4-hydroxy-6-hydroxymethyldihydropteridine diphosphokinase